MLTKDHAAKLVYILLKRDPLNCGRSEEQLRKAAVAAVAQSNVIEALTAMESALTTWPVPASAAARDPLSVPGGSLGGRSGS